MKNARELQEPLEEIERVDTDASLFDEVMEEFGGFCSESRIRAKGGCCRLIHTMDEFFPEPEHKEYDHEN